MTISATTETTTEAFESEFGLEANTAPEPPAPDGEVEAQAEAGAVDEPLDGDPADANLLGAADAAEAVGADEAEAGAAAESGAIPEGGAEGDPEAAEAGAADGGAAGEGGEGGEGELDPAEAQAYLDFLLESLGDQLRFRYRANGEDREVPWSELRDAAAGYHGQGVVDQQLQEMTHQREAAEASVAEAERIVNEAREDLSGYATEPQRYLEEFVYPQGGVEAIRAMRDRAEALLESIESDPNGYAMRHEMRRELEGLRAELRQGRDDRQAPEGEPAPAAPADSDIPADFGFMPGKGYPKPFVQAAFRALEAASKVAGVDVNQVLDRWEKEGRKQTDPFRVLEEMVAATTRNTPKVALAKNPPARPLPKGRVGSGGAAPKPSGAPAQRRRFSDLEHVLAKALEDANRSGASA